MYDELVKWMRKCATEVGACKTCELDSNPSCTDVLMEQAADAIEQLSNAGSAYGRGWTLGYDAGREESKPRWIPVTERLPEHEYGESTSVLTVDLYGVMRVTYFDGGNWCWPSGEALTTTRVAPITHWMSLPPAPKDGE